MHGGAGQRTLLTSCEFAENVSKNIWSNTPSLRPILGGELRNLIKLRWDLKEGFLVGTIIRVLLRKYYNRIYHYTIGILWVEINRRLIY